MTREDKCKLAIQKGFTYDPETGKIYGIYGKEIIRKHISGYCEFKFKDDNGKEIQLKSHQFAWYWVNKEIVNEIDHINGIRDDNRICNLRSVTHQQNGYNRTTAKGYYFVKRDNIYRAEITFNSKKITLGSFEKEEDARAAYLEAKEKYHII
jgi:hypothetical protein